MDLSLSGWQVIERVFEIFILMLFGVFGRKFGFIREEARESLGDMMLNVAFPPLIFGSMVSDIHWESSAIWWIIPLISFLLVFIGIVIISIVGRFLPLPADRVGTFTILVTMPNTAFIGFPVVFSLFGKEGLAYAVFYDFGITIAFFTIAIMVLKGGERRKDWWRVLVNPPLLAVILGLFVNRSGLKLPALVMEPLEIMGSAALPLAMLLMGYMIGGVHFSLKSMNLDLIMVCLGKLLLYPLLAWLGLSPFKLDPVFREVILMEAAMPSMASTAVLVQKYGGDESFAASGTFLTTLFSMITIPLLVSLGL